MDRIGFRVREARESLGLTVVAFARVIDASQETVSRWENGHQRPSLEMIDRIAKLSGKSIDWFMAEADDVTPTGTDG